MARRVWTTVWGRGVGAPVIAGLLFAGPGCTGDAARDSSAGDEGTGSVGTDDATGGPQTGAADNDGSGTAGHGTGGAGTGGPDTGAPDTGAPDTGAPDTGGSGTGDPDTGRVDASVSDTNDDGDASTSGSPMGSQWAQTQLSYSGQDGLHTVDVDDCTFCDATLNEVTLLVRFQQAEGWTVWSLDIPLTAVVGAHPVTDDYSGVYVAINEQGPQLPNDYTGFYAPTTGSGTLTLTQADLVPGGVVAGTIDAQLSLGGVQADLQAEFYAEIP